MLYIYLIEISLKLTVVIVWKEQAGCMRKLSNKYLYGDKILKQSMRTNIKVL